MSDTTLYNKHSGHKVIEWFQKISNHEDFSDIFINTTDKNQLIQFILSCEPTDFKDPRKPRASKKSSDQRYAESYNDSLCDARVWNDSLGAQCSRAKSDGQCLCNIHLKEAAKNDGKLRNGFFNMFRPIYPYDDESRKPLPWHDADLPVKQPKKSKTKNKPGVRKCGHCNAIGHNKRTCPVLSGEANLPTPTPEATQEANLEQTTTAQFNDARVQLSNALQANPPTQPQAQEEEQPQEEEQEEQESIIPANNDNEENDTGAGTGLKNDTQDSQDSQATVLIPDDQLDIDLTPDNSSTSLEILTFQGVTYQLDPEDNVVYNLNTDEIGEWDGSSIMFNNGEDSRAHAEAAKEIRRKKLDAKED